MSTRARKNCSGPQCYNLVGPGRPCPIHPPRKAWRTSTGTRQERGYDSQHDALRRQVAQEEPCCRTCRSEATPWVMDHIHPLCEGGLSTRDNVQRLCPSCSKAKTHAEATRALRAAKKRYGFKMDAGSES